MLLGRNASQGFRKLVSVATVGECFQFFFLLISFDVIVCLFQFVVAMRIVISFRQFTVPTYSLSLVRL